MHLLAIDTATRRVGVAIGGADGVLGAIELGGLSSPGPPRHAEVLAPAIERLCRDTGVTPDRFAAVAVGIGPGMFTGLRVGVTTAKAIAWTLRIPVVPVPSLDLVAYPLRFTERLVVPALDARRHEVYYAVYRPVPGGIQRESDYELGSPDDVVAELLSRGEDALLAGEGALRFADELSSVDRLELAGPGHGAPSLAALVELASARYEREEFCPPAEVAPLYLRRSDAELARDARS